MSSVTLDVNPSIRGTISTPADTGSVRKDFKWPSAAVLYPFTPGTGDLQLDAWFDDVRTVASGATDSLDLTGTALKDPFGNNIAFGHVKLIALYADPANTTDLTFGNDTNPFVFLGAAAHTLVLKPGDCAVFVRPDTGWAVTAGTGDILKAVNGSGAAASYTIALGGVSV